MKAVILAGGFGTRLNEETVQKPKPMIEIGGKPMLWHILKIYSTYDINEFVICLGYKSNSIKDYFLKNSSSRSDKIDDSTLNLEFSNGSSVPLKVTLVDTGLNTMTGGRLKRIKKFVDKETFCFTYGDTLNDVNIQNLINFHIKMKTLATVTACIPPEKYGILTLKDDKVIEFKEKPIQQKDWVNGGYFILEPGVFDYIEDDSTIWEKEPMEELAKDGELSAYRHTGFYQPMDTLHNKNHLNDLWNNGLAKWKVW